MSKNKSEEVFPEILKLLEKLVEDQKSSGMEIRSCLEEAKKLMNNNRSALFIDNDEVTKVIIDFKHSDIKASLNSIPNFPKEAQAFIEIELANAIQNDEIGKGKRIKSTSKTKKIENTSSNENSDENIDLDENFEVKITSKSLDSMKDSVEIKTLLPLYEDGPACKNCIEKNEKLKQYYAENFTQRYSTCPSNSKERYDLIKDALKGIYFREEYFKDCSLKFQKAFENIEHINQLLEFIFVNIKEFCESVKKFFFENFDFITIKKPEGFRNYVSLSNQEPVYRKILQNFLDSWASLLRIRQEIDLVIESFRDLKGHKKATTTYNIPSSHEQIYFYVVLNFPHIKKFLDFLYHELEHSECKTPKSYTTCKMAFIKLKEIILTRSQSYFDSINCKHCKIKNKIKEKTLELENLVSLETLQVEGENSKKKRKKKKKKKVYQTIPIDLKISEGILNDSDLNEKEKQEELLKKKGSFENLLLEFEKKLEFDRENSSDQKLNLNISADWVEGLKKKIK